MHCFWASPPVLAHLWVCSLGKGIRRGEGRRRVDLSGLVCGHILLTLGVLLLSGLLSFPVVPVNNAPLLNLGGSVMLRGSLSRWTYGGYLQNIRGLSGDLGGIS